MRVDLLTRNRIDGILTVCEVNSSVLSRVTIVNTCFQVPSAGAIKDGETVKIECLDWYGLISILSFFIHIHHKVSILTITQDWRPNWQ